MDKTILKYIPLVAPAVTFLLVLCARQSRISAIARDNARLILESKRQYSDRGRVKNLIEQNRTLIARYQLIQCGLIVLCLGLCALGCVALHEFFKGILFMIGVLAIILGTLSILLEIATGADTLLHELVFAEWYRHTLKDAKRQAPGIKKFAIRYAPCSIAYFLSNRLSPIGVRRRKSIREWAKTRAEKEANRR